MLFNIVFASTFTLCIKWAQNRQRDDIVTIGAINYIVAAVLILPVFWQKTGSIQAGELDRVMINAVVTGGLMGGFYFAAFFFCDYAVRWVGAASSTVVAVLSMLLPIACGVFYWSEDPNTYQLIGIALALIALSLIGGKIRQPGQADRPWFTPIVLFAFFLLCGFSRLAQEAFKHTSEPDQRSTFLMTAYAVATLPSIGILTARRRRPSIAELSFGFVMGSANILQSHFLLKSLQYFDGCVVFPAVSAGSVILTTVVATGMLAEQHSRRTYAGISIAVIALVLLNWLPS